LSAALAEGLEQIEAGQRLSVARRFSIFCATRLRKNDWNPGLALPTLPHGRSAGQGSALRFSREDEGGNAAANQLENDDPTGNTGQNRAPYAL